MEVEQPIGDQVEVQDSPTLPEVGISEMAACSPNLERRKRIESSPIKSYYKMTPLDDGGVTDTELTNQQAEESLLMVFGRSQEEKGLLERVNESSMIVHLDSDVSGQKDLQDVLSLLDDSFENQPMSDSLFCEQIEEIGREGTTWKPFIGRKKGEQEEEVESRNAEDGEWLDLTRFTG